MVEVSVFSADAPIVPARGPDNGATGLKHPAKGLFGLANPEARDVERGVALDVGVTATRAIVTDVPVPAGHVVNGVVLEREPAFPPFPLPTPFQPPFTFTTGVVFHDHLPFAERAVADNETVACLVDDAGPGDNQG